MSRGRVYWRVAFAASSIALILVGRSSAVDRARAADPPSAGQAAVIRYLSYHGYVRTFEIAQALEWLRGKGIRIESEGYSQGGPESLAAMASGSIDLAGAADAGDHQCPGRRRQNPRRDARRRHR